MLIYFKRYLLNEFITVIYITTISSDIVHLIFNHIVKYRLIENRYYYPIFILGNNEVRS